PPNAAYAFDKNGNRTMTGYQVAAGNEIASDGTFNYQFDGEGNRTLRTRVSNSPANDYQTKYVYDYRNRLTDEEYFNNSGTLTKHVHYAYDTMDHQIGEQVDDTGSGSYDRTARYAFDGGLPVDEFDGAGNITERDFNGPSPAGVDAVIAQEPIITQGRAGNSNWGLADNLSTLRYLVSDSSAVVDHVITDAFGETTSESNTAVSHWTGFGGGHADSDTHDVLDGERRYDASTGNWQTKDPIGLAGGDANTGRYANNSPTSAVDPNGLAAKPSNSLTNNPLYQLQENIFGPINDFFGWTGESAVAMAQTQAQKAQMQAQAGQAMMAQQQAMMAQQQAAMGQQQQALMAPGQAMAAQQQAMMAQQQSLGGQQMQVGAQQMAAQQQTMQQMGAQQQVAQQAQIQLAAAAGAGAQPPQGSLAGATGGAVTGAGIGTIMGGIGATVVVVGIAVASATPIGIAAVTVVGIGIGVGALTGGLIGGYYGSGQNTLSAGAVAAASQPGTYWVPFVSGGLWAYSAYAVTAPAALGGSPYVNYPWWWPW
ncbi:MAG: RHS repeat-associated core domain-containing protein, partial [Candidatus Saccharimonadales bacterium]